MRNGQQRVLVLGSGFQIPTFRFCDGPFLVEEVRKWECRRQNVECRMQKAEPGISKILSILSKKILWIGGGGRRVFEPRKEWDWENSVDRGGHRR